MPSLVRPHGTAGTVNFTLAEVKADWEVAWHPAKSALVALAPAAVDTGTKAQFLKR
jgi:hypothetical protein